MSLSYISGLHCFWRRLSSVTYITYPLYAKCLYFLTPFNIFSIILVFQEFLLKCAQVLFSWLLTFFSISVSILKNGLMVFIIFRQFWHYHLTFPPLLSVFSLSSSIMHMLFLQIFEVLLLSPMSFVCSHFLEFLWIFWKNRVKLNEFYIYNIIIFRVAALISFYI